MRFWRVRNPLCFITFLLWVDAQHVVKDDVDKVLEDEITEKLGEDLLQSVERKFQVDLERSVEMVLIKIKLLLQNGTQHIQDKLLDIQGTLDSMKSHGEKEVDACLTKKQNETSTLAEKALHQMVICGYALIGQDPAQAVHKVVTLKNMIKLSVKPLYEQKKEIYGLLKVCGHDHDSLKKVVKCVISKSPLLKSVMMEISEKLISGVVDLTKLMAHGAMHEACLIEVIKSIEDEAAGLVKAVKTCAFGNENFAYLDKYIADNNATVLDVPNEASVKDSGNLTNVKNILNRMMEEKGGEQLDDRFKDKLKKLQNDLDAGNLNLNAISNDLVKDL
ncbi:uncharacterized protein LOC120626900 [Pararge aegeria]|uniref:uncharacterized protein LOC120626900 n=1 Tax=Pararge aegeria TaxID=116150 RepID=UPI0019D08564|nr:uncharacterized protein LOC120626900 [Pararge aegeria]